MSKYDKDTKFYFLQLKEDFFDDDAINWLEDQEPNGRDYAYFYLKLCLKSLKSNGILIRNVGDILIPYDNKKLSELTKMDFDTVTVAMELLKKIGLIKILESGEIYLTQLQNLIGSRSVGALKKQQQRLINRQEADICPPKIELEQEIELKNINRIKSITTIIENNFGRSLSPIELEKINYWLSLFDDEIIQYAIEISILNHKPNLNYINGILTNWKTAGYKTIEEIKECNKYNSPGLTEELKQNLNDLDDYNWWDEHIEEDEKIENNK